MPKDNHTKRLQKHDSLSRGGVVAQAEAIAEHYSKLAAAAINLKSTIGIIKREGIGDAGLQVLQDIVSGIQELHAADLGIELTWETLTTDQP